MTYNDKGQDEEEEDEIIDINEDDLEGAIEDLQSQIDNAGFDRKLEEDEEGHYEYA